MKIKNTLVLTMTTIYLSGCATPSLVENMIVTSDSTSQASTNSLFAQKLTIGEVNGGSETNPMFSSQVSSEDFKAALAGSLENSGFLSSSVPQYKIDAKLIALDQPFMGLNMTVKSTVDYVITEINSNKEMLDKTIEASFSATMSDAFVGVTRLRLSNEGSIKRNIQLLIKELNKVQ